MSVVLFLIDDFPSISLIGTSDTIVIGTSIFLKCTTTLEVNSPLIWLKDDNLVNMDETVARHNILYIGNFQESFIGNYTCVAVTKQSESFSSRSLRIEPQCKQL